MANVKYGQSSETDTAYKIIADHVRTVAFAVGDQARPSNEGRGYILRRLIRRAVRYAKNIGIEKPFMYKLVPVVGKIMEDYYPEVRKQEDIIMKVIKNEEQRFYETLQDGMQILTEMIEQQKQTKNKVIPGDVVFKLYDTYGFPKELTEEFVAEHGYTIDEAQFQEEMEKQRERARAARDTSNSMQIQDQMLTNLNEESTFIGYHHLKITTKIVKMMNDEGNIEKALKEEKVFVVLDETPFYAESGGQVADKGKIYTTKGTATVLDEQKAPHGQHIHQVVVDEGVIAINDAVNAEVTEDYRKAIIKNHTATHLLHQALRDVLGEHIEQAGSLVASDRLRFDFSHDEAISNEQLEKIEQIVNEKIWSEIPLKIEEMPIDKAKSLGAMALFGEKYGDVVRVVQIGDYSIELCGGCHVENSAHIGLFKIISATGIGADVRRIEAITSKNAYQWLQQKAELLTRASSLLKTKETNILDKIKSNQLEMKQLEKENESLMAKQAIQEIDEMIARVRVVEGVNVLSEKVNVKNMDQLRTMVDHLKQKVSSSVILLAIETNGKVQFISGVTNDLVSRHLHAGKLINEVAKICGGGGGGRPDMAQAGAKDASQLNKAFEIVDEYVKNNIK